MEWTNQDRLALLRFKDAIDSDDIKIKEKVKKLLLSNKYIMHVLNNVELEKQDAELDEYYLNNIFPYYVITETQSEVKHFICFETSYKELQRYNDSAKYMQLIFYILCHEKDNIDADTGIARHDLLGALIQDQFNYTNYFGNKIKLVEDTSGAIDSNYALRTLVFEQITDNNLVKNGKLANKEVHILG